MLYLAGTSCPQPAVVAEWLRRLTRNQIPSGSVGSNPTDCEVSFLLTFLFKEGKNKGETLLVVQYLKLVLNYLKNEKNPRPIFFGRKRFIFKHLKKKKKKKKKSKHACICTYMLHELFSSKCVNVISSPCLESRWDCLTFLIWHTCIVGSVVECSPATRAARVRFPDDAMFYLIFRLRTQEIIEKSCGGAGYRSRYLSHAKRALYHLSYAPSYRWYKSVRL